MKMSINAWLRNRILLRKALYQGEPELGRITVLYFSDLDIVLN